MSKEFAASVLKEKPLVWVIEDVLQDQEILSAKLECSGFRVEAFRTHRLAAEHIGEGCEVPSVMFCDYETETSYNADWFMQQLKDVGWLDKTRVIAASGSNALNELMQEEGAHGQVDNNELRQILYGDTMAAGARKLKDIVERMTSRSR